MKMIYILLITIFIGCNSNINRRSDFESMVKWDFYKKNTLKYFTFDSLKIPYYMADLTIQKLNNKSDESLNCFIGEFSVLKYSLSSKDNGNMDVPTVYSICYNVQNKINKYFLGDYAFIDQIDASAETKEDQNLYSIIETKEVCKFLKDISE